MSKSAPLDPQSFAYITYTKLQNFYFIVGTKGLWMHHLSNILLVAS